MAIVGLSINKIAGERKEVELKGEMHLTSTHTITDIREEDNIVLGKKILAVDFTLSTEYSQSVGTISLAGQLLYLAEEEMRKEVLRQWKAKKMPDAFGAEIITAIYRKGLLLAAQLSIELQLPPPVVIPMPQKQPAQPDNKPVAVKAAKTATNN